MSRLSMVLIFVAVAQALLTFKLLDELEKMRAVYEAILDACGDSWSPLTEQERRAILEQVK